MYYPSSKNKGADHFAVTAKLICAFVFAYRDCWFSHVAAQFFFQTDDIHKHGESVNGSFTVNIVFFPIFLFLYCFLCDQGLVVRKFIS